MSTKDEVIAKVRKLLAYAVDQEGTPEGESYQRKALELMNQFSISEYQLREATGEGSTEMSSLRVTHDSPYTQTKSHLLLCLADSLHCVGMFVPCGRSVLYTEIFGRTHHVDRVRILFSLLTEQMVLGAKRAADAAKRNGYVSRPNQTTLLKKSWMYGYIEAVCTRLAEIERVNTPGWSTPSKPGDLVLISDVDAARHARDSKYPDLTLSPARERKINSLGYSLGWTAGKLADIGTKSAARGFGIAIEN